MTELQFHHGLLVGWLLVSVVVFVYLLLFPAPYGRHQRAGWGPRLPAKLAWLLMEAPAVVTIAVCFLAGDRFNLLAVVFLLLWEFHYVYRTFVFPMRMRGRGQAMPLAIVASGFAFNVINGYLNGRWLFALGPARAAGWLIEPRLLCGVALFAAGFVIHYKHDGILLALRGAGEGGYKIPRGGLYRFVSCPNYLGEIVEWAGFALAAWSPPALAFSLWTAANLVPRALAHHRWYRSTFADYPRGRKAVLPFLL
jgi:steroid 5-alpha-reductase/3-oxo-5-alpha-steroid 4-dehydrogenase 1